MLKTKKDFRGELRERVFSNYYPESMKVELLRAISNLDVERADYEVILKSRLANQRSTGLRRIGRLADLIIETELEFMKRNKTLYIVADYGIILNLPLESFFIPAEYWIEFVRSGSHVRAVC